MFRDTTPQNVLVGTPLVTPAGLSNFIVIPTSGATWTLTSGITVSQPISGPASFGMDSNWQSSAGYPSLTITAIGGPLVVFYNNDISASGSSSGGGGGGGDATAANQVIQINQLNVIVGAKTQTSLIATGAGNIPLGAFGYTVINYGFLDGTLNGSVFPIGASFSSDKTLVANVPYNATGTSFRIDYWV